MRHRRFDIATLSLEGIDVGLKAAYLLVAEQDGLDDLQWECLAYALDPAPLEQRTYQLAATTLDGRRLHGPALLVRSVEGAHVLRGAGELVGVDPAELT